MHCLLLPSLFHRRIGSHCRPGFAGRTYESQLTTELATPLAAATDSANNAWIGDAGGGIYKFNSANERLAEHITGSSFSCNGERVYSLAVDESDDDLYAATSCGDTVDRFSSTGTLLNTLGPFGNGNVFVAVDNTSGPNKGRVYAAETEGATVNSVDSSGNPVEFTASASYISGNQLTGTPSAHFGAPVGVAVATSGDILVVDAKQGQFGEQGRNVIDEFEPSGVFIREITGPPGEPFGDVTAVATDPTTGDILAVDRGEHAGEDEEPAVVDEFNSSGTYQTKITGAETPAGSLGYDSFDPGGVGVSSSGYLYVPDVTHHLVDIFSPTFSLPKVTYEGVTNGTAAETSATLNATVDPNGGGPITTCMFEYVDEASYQPAAHNPFNLGHGVPCNPTPSGTGPSAVSADISGLAPETTYRYRLAVSNAAGTPNVAAPSFKFQPPSVEGVSSSGLAAESAHLNAKVDPEGLDTHYHFEYGTTATYGFSAPIPDVEIGSADVAHPVGVEIAGLTKGATYHFPESWPPTPWGRLRAKIRLSASFRRHVQMNTFDSRPAPSTYPTVEPMSLSLQNTPEGPPSFRKDQIHPLRPIRPAFPLAGCWGRFPALGMRSTTSATSMSRPAPTQDG